MGIAYEWYVDVFFCVNYLMELTGILTAAICGSCQIRLKRMLLVSAIAVLTEILLLWLLPSYLFYRLVMYLAIHPGMVWMIFSPKTISAFVRHLFIQSLTFFAIGGIQESLLLHWKSGNTGQILMCGILCAVVTGIYFQRRKTLRFLCKVDLIFQGRKVCVSAFWDSGNHLCEPDSGAPVCILEENVWLQLIKALPDVDEKTDAKEGGTRGSLSEKRIRYSTVSGQEQSILLVTPDEMDIYQASGIRKIKKPKIGLAPGILMQHPRAQMLLHNFYME